MKNLTLISSFCLCTLIGFTQNVPQLSFKDAYIVQHNLKVGETYVGGLSGIEYSGADNVYLAVADKPDTRFYNIKIDVGQYLDVQFKDAVTMVEPSKGEDESIRIRPATHDVYLTDERSNKVYLWQTQNYWPYTVELPLPQKYDGMQSNAGFEGMAFSELGDTLYLSLERPLKREQNCGLTHTVGGLTRILALDLQNQGKVLAEYAYPLENLDSIASGDNGISEIVHWKDDLFFVMERVFFSSLGRTSVRIFLVDFSQADDVKNLDMCNLPMRTRKLKPIKLFDFFTFRGTRGFTKADNLEGMCIIADGKHLLLLSDNNFRSSQQTQIICLKID